MSGPASSRAIENGASISSELDADTITDTAFAEPAGNGNKAASGAGLIKLLCSRDQAASDQLPVETEPTGRVEPAVQLVQDVSSDAPNVDAKVAGATTQAATGGTRCPRIQINGRRPLKVYLDRKGASYKTLLVETSGKNAWTASDIISQMQEKLASGATVICNFFCVVYACMYACRYACVLVCCCCVSSEIYESDPCSENCSAFGIGTTVPQTGHRKMDGRCSFLSCISISETHSLLVRPRLAHETAN